MDGEKGNTMICRVKCNHAKNVKLIYPQLHNQHGQIIIFLNDDVLFQVAD